MRYFDQFADQPKRFYAFLFWRYLFGALPFNLLGAILTLFEVLPIRFNNETHVGVKGFVIVLFFYLPFFSVMFSTMTWLVLSLGGKVLELIGARPINSDQSAK